MNGATLIDNIFTNDMPNYVRSGLLINDISDHLPVFSIYNCRIQRNEEEIYGRIARVRTKEAINELRNGLLKELWRGVYIEDVNAASESISISIVL